MAGPGDRRYEAPHESCPRCAPFVVLGAPGYGPGRAIPGASESGGVAHGVEERVGAGALVVVVDRGLVEPQGYVGAVGEEEMNVADVELVVAAFTEGVRALRGGADVQTHHLAQRSHPGLADRGLDGMVLLVGARLVLAVIPFGVELDDDDDQAAVVGDGTDVPDSGLVGGVPGDRANDAVVTDESRDVELDAPRRTIAVTGEAVGRDLRPMVWAHGEFHGRTVTARPDRPVVPRPPMVAAAAVSVVAPCRRRASTGRRSRVRSWGSVGARSPGSVTRLNALVPCSQVAGHQ
jgi:hypothetical protein